jgi:hypothetical protein
LAPLAMPVAIDASRIILCVLLHPMKSTPSLSIERDRKGETVYTGHPAVNNTDHPFTPGDLEVTKSDNIIVTDTQNHTLHILDSDGKCLQYINTKDIGIKWPWSILLKMSDADLCEPII